MFASGSSLLQGLARPWTRDGGIPQGCPWSMMFIVALYLPWCRYLGAQCGVSPQPCANNLMCVSGSGLVFACCQVYHCVCQVGWPGAGSQLVCLAEYVQSWTR